MSPETRRQITQTRYATLSLCGIGVAASCLFHAIEMDSVAGIVGLSTLAGLANLAMLGRDGASAVSPYWCSHFLVAALFAALVGSTLLVGGFYHPSFAWFYVLPMAATAVLRLRSLWIWVGITIATCFVFWSLPYLGAPLASPTPKGLNPVYALALHVTAILALGLIATSFQLVQRRAARELDHANTVLRRETAYVTLLQGATVSANEAGSPEEAMRRSVARICTTMGWTGGHIYRVGHDGLLRKTEQWLQQASGSQHFAELGSEIFAPGAGLPGRAMVSERPESIPDLSRFATDRAHRADELGLRSAIAVPILAHGRVVAVLEFASIERVDVDQRFDEVLSLIGEQLGRVFERNSLQDRLRQSQKMEAVGRLAAGLAHEINNPMSYVRSNLNQLYREWEAAADRVAKRSEAIDPEIADALDECHELIRESRDGVERTIAIVRDVKDFSHISDAAREPADLNEIVESSIRVAAPRNYPNLRIERCFAELPRVRCSANQIQQVVVNLIVNSLQATGGEGLLSVETGRDGECAWVRIEDDGPGIRARDREHLFEPFFTTKPVGEGTGLGLYVSYEIVCSHGGEITVQSEPGAGSCFEIRLPLPAEADETPAVAG